jgi:hypothetical protein
MRAVKRYRDGVLDESAPIEEVVREAFGEGVLYALFWVPPYATAFTLERVFSMTYQKPDRAKLLSEEFITKCLGDLLTIEDTGVKEGVSKECRKFYEYTVSKMWGVAPRGLVTYAETAHALYITTNRDLARWAWLITRIGRREDVAFVRDVSVFGLGDLVVSPNEDSLYTTRFYMPSRLVREASNKRVWVLREVVNGIIREGEFLVPVGVPVPVPIAYKPNPNEALVIRLQLGGGVEHVPIPREVVGGGW